MSPANSWKFHELLMLGLRAACELRPLKLRCVTRLYSRPFHFTIMHRPHSNTFCCTTMQDSENVIIPSSQKSPLLNSKRSATQHGPRVFVHGGHRNAILRFLIGHVHATFVAHAEIPDIQNIHEEDRVWDWRHEVDPGTALRFIDSHLVTLTVANHNLESVGLYGGVHHHPGELLILYVMVVTFEKPELEVLSYKF